MGVVFFLTEPQIGTVGRQGERGGRGDGYGKGRRLQTWRLVRMGDEEKRARIGASPYDRVLRGILVESVCRNVVYHIRSIVDCYN